MSHTASDKSPTAPARFDPARLPSAPYTPLLAGQPALVTGANSGIGQAVALGMAKAGADVVVNYVTNPEAADAVAHEITAMGRRAIVLKADVSNEDEVEAMYAAAIKEFGTLHISVSILILIVRGRPLLLVLTKPPSRVQMQTQGT